MPDSVAELTEQLDHFANDQAWQQFHSRKPLASEMVVDAGEPLANFQWLTAAQCRTLSPECHDAPSAEMADMHLYLVKLAGAPGDDPIGAVKVTLKLNMQRYPVALARGSSAKYVQR